LRVFQKRVLKKIFGATMVELEEGWREVHLPALGIRKDKVITRIRWE